MSEAPRRPGHELRGPDGARPGAPARARLVAGQVAARAARPCSPRGSLARLPGDAPERRAGPPEPPRRRFATAALEPRGLDGQLQLYAVPTTAAWRPWPAPPPAGAAGDRLPARLRERGGHARARRSRRPTRSVRARSTRAGCATVMGRLAAARRTGDAAPAGGGHAGRPGRCAGTRSRAATCRAARALADTKVSPADAAANRALAARARAHRARPTQRAADAARAGERGRVRRGRAGAQGGAGRQLREALSGLEQLGYALS